MAKKLTVLNGDVPNLDKLSEAPKSTGASRIPDEHIYPREDRLIVSPFRIDHRGEVIRELEDDANILIAEAEAMELEAQKKRQWAEALKISAVHLKTHPPQD